MTKGSIAELATYLTIREIAELWSAESGEAREVVERALMERAEALSFEEWQFMEAESEEHMALLVHAPDFMGRLPITPNSVFQRRYLKIMCEQRGLPLPKFWFPEGRASEADTESFPGRPSVMKAIKMELEKRATAGKLRSLVTDEAKSLAAWADEQFPKEQTPKPRSIANAIRDRFRELKGTTQN